RFLRLSTILENTGSQTWRTFLTGTTFPALARFAKLHLCAISVTTKSKAHRRLTSTMKRDASLARVPLVGDLVHRHHPERLVLIARTILTSRASQLSPRMIDLCGTWLDLPRQSKDTNTSPLWWSMRKHYKCCLSQCTSVGLWSLSCRSRTPWLTCSWQWRA